MDPLTEKQRETLYKLIDIVEEKGGIAPLDKTEVDDLSVGEAGSFIAEILRDLGWEE